MSSFPGLESRPHLAEDGPPVLSAGDRHAARPLHCFVHATAAGGCKAEIAEEAERICGGGGGHGGGQEARTGTDKHKSIHRWELGN